MLVLQFKCCGSTDYTGWKTILDGDVPDSCCRTVTRACGHGAAAKEQSVVTAKIYTQVGSEIYSIVPIINLNHFNIKPSNYHEFS